MAAGSVTTPRGGKLLEFPMRSVFHRLSRAEAGSLTGQRWGDHNCGKRAFYRRDRFVASLLNTVDSSRLDGGHLASPSVYNLRVRAASLRCWQFNIICQICPCLASLFRSYVVTFSSPLRLSGSRLFPPPFLCFPFFTPFGLLTRQRQESTRSAATTCSTTPPPCSTSASLTSPVNH